MSVATVARIPADNDTDKLSLDMMPRDSDFIWLVRIKLCSELDGVGGLCVYVCEGAEKIQPQPVRLWCIVINGFDAENVSDVIRTILPHGCNDGLSSGTERWGKLLALGLMLCRCSYCWTVRG
ncbi:hypothetical protein RRG08_007565 [Elysia crispata]|uniref:Uncharacterized protein n=1 Tax=Elysia crispata TaxID=231223 RepID=A0AAE0Z2T1_9GAST|nr:hypothetical protein RRG08_007565 [Elysia crispata]